MRVLAVTVFSGLLIFTTSIRESELSLIGRGRRAKFPDFPPPSFQDTEAKMTLGSSADPVSKTLASTPVIYPADAAMNRQQDIQAVKQKVEAADEEFEALAPPQIDFELRIPTSLQKIQGGRLGPLSVFLDTVESELCKAGKLSNNRLQLLGIRGEYTRVPLNKSSSISLTGNNGTNSSLWDEHPIMTMADQHVIIDLEVLPGSSGFEPTPEDISSLWKAQLTTAGSPLLRGPLGMLFKGASIQKPPDTTDRNAVNMVSSSAHFTNGFKSSAIQFQSLSWTLVLLSFFVGLSE